VATPGPVALPAAALLPLRAASTSFVQ
jgi:hypothetical protein